MIESAQKAIPAELIDEMNRYEADYNRGDAAAVATQFSDQVSWCGTVTGTLKSPRQIQAAMQKFMDAGLKTLKLEPVEAKLEGDQGFLVAHYRYYGADGKLLQSGNTLSLLERHGGQLRIHHQWAVGDAEPK